MDEILDEIEMDNKSIKNETKEKKKGLAALWQFIKFGLVGVSNTVVSYVTYSLVYYWVLGSSAMADDIKVQIANIVGFVISVLNAFIWQSKFVFKEEEGGEHRVWWKVLIKTYISYAFSGLLLTALLLAFWLKVVHIEQYLGGVAQWLVQFGLNLSATDVAASIAPFLNMVITIPINFCINKFWAYRQKGKKSEVTE